MGVIWIKHVVIYSVCVLCLYCRYVTELLGDDKYVSCSVVLSALCHLLRIMEVSDVDPAYIAQGCIYRGPQETKGEHKPLMAKGSHSSRSQIQGPQMPSQSREERGVAKAEWDAERQKPCATALQKKNGTRATKEEDGPPTDGIRVRVWRWGSVHSHMSPTVVVGTHRSPW